MLSIPSTEKLALRNSLAVFVVFAALKGLRSGKKAKKGEKDATAKPKSSGYTEAIHTSLAAGLTAEVFSRGQTLTGSSELGGMLSILPLRLLCNNDSYHFNYKFVITYLTAQVLASKLPKSSTRNLVLMMISASQLLGWWMIADDRLPGDYVRFLDREGKVCRTGIRDEQGKLKGSQLVQLREIFKNESGKHTWKELIPLCFPRPNGECLSEKYDAKDSIVGHHKAALEYFVHHFRESMPFYTKVYVFRFIASLLRGKNSAKVAKQAADWTVTERIAIALAGDPNIVKVGETFASVAKDIGRSSAFLALYCTLAFWGIGMAGHMAPDVKTSPSHPLMWLVLSIPGLSVLIESESQKVTLANYCATFGLYPLFSSFPVLFDVSALLTTAVCGSDSAARPALLNLLWPADPAGALKALAASQMRQKAQEAVRNAALADVGAAPVVK